MKWEQPDKWKREINESEQMWKSFKKIMSETKGFDRKH